MAMISDYDAFQYTSSLRGRRIRLLFIQPPYSGDHSSLLQVNLVEEPLDATDFDALSYVWGKCSQKFRIRCNDKNIDIGQNLYEALIEARSRGVSRGLWADAICINQADEAEKNEQVQLMSSIYSAAAHTIIWLGTGLYDDEQGIHLAQFIHAKCHSDDPWPMDDTYSNADFDCRARGVPTLRNGSDINPSWKALFHILNYPWFSRVWVIQELVLSSNPLIWRGSRTIDTHALIWMAYHVGSKRDIQTCFATIHGFGNFYASSIVHFFYNVRMKQICQKPPIWTNLLNSMGMQATDPRDRFFAIAGISAHLPTNFVDYSRTLEQVASQVGLITFMGGQDFPASIYFDVLADYPSIHLRIQHSQIPSWVPDFFSDQIRGVPLSRYYSTKVIRKQQIGFPNAELRLTIEEPDGSLKQSVSPRFPCLYHKVKEAHVRSIIFDKIKDIMPLTDLIKNEKSHQRELDRYSTESLYQQFDGAYQLSRRIISFIDKARLLAEPELRNCSVMSGQTFDAFWRTLLYNRTQFTSDNEIEPDNGIGISFGYWYLMLKLISTIPSKQDPWSSSLHSMALRPLAHPFKSIFDQIYSNRRFFVSENGKIGWAPPYARSGDSLVVFQGSRIPLAARLVGENVWECVGGCYVHGCMDGEIWKATKSDWDFLKFI